MPAEFAGIDTVSRETLSRLEAYASLLRKWNPAINLVAPSTLSQLWHRHIADSAQLLRHAPEGKGVWADLGSGGGFPGAVVAILCRELRPDIRVACVESDQRKAVFLRSVSRETETAFDVVNARIEEAAPLNADVVSARALAPLPDLLEYVHRHLEPGGVALLMKGARHEEEVAQARKQWRFDLEAVTSETDPAATILKIGGVRRA